MRSAPLGWNEIRLGDICEFKYGKSLPDAKRSGGSVPVFGSNGQVGTHDTAITSGAAIVIGRKGSFGEVTWSDVPCWPIDTTYFVDESATDVDLRWLAYRLRGLGLTELNRAAAVPGLNREDAYRKRLLLPPPEEQRRIAEVLDRVEALRAKRRTVIDQIETVKQSMFLDMFGDPSRNPKDWPVTSLGETASFVGGGTPRRENPSYFEGSICWATSKDMKGEYLEETQEHITEVAIRESATNLVPAGTILVVVKSKVLAHSLPVLIARVPTCFGQDIKGILVDDEWRPSYIAASIRAQKRVLLGKARGINTEGLTLEHLKSLPIIRPPTDVLAEFDERCTYVDGLYERQVSSQRSLDSLFESTTQLAFSGRL